MSTGETNRVDFRHLVEGSPEVTVVMVADVPNFTIVAVSDAYLEATLKTRDKIVGRGLFDVFDAYDDEGKAGLAQVRSSLEKAVSTGEVRTFGPFRYDIEDPKEPGAPREERYWTATNVPIRGDDGAVAHLVHRIEDVTDFIFRERDQNWRAPAGATKAVVDELGRALEQKTRRQFYDMFMKAPAFIAMLEGPQHTFTVANQAYYELIDHREVIGRAVDEVFPEQEIDKFGAILDHVYQAEEPQVFHEQEIVLRDPKDRSPYMIYATFAYLPNYDLQGNVEGVAVFGFDVTELVEARKKVEAQAERAERENRHKDEFLAMLGHELRNPLAPISMAVDVMRAGEDGYDDDKIAWGTDLIVRQLHQLTRLVDDLLDVARINQGRIELKKERCLLEDIVSSALEACQPLISRKEQTLDIEIPEEPVLIEADPARLTQVLANLLNNASKYTHDGGRLAVDAQVHDGRLRIAVTDNGQGIDAELLPYIFELFTQEETSLDRSRGGLGLGLTLVRRLVDLHDGDVAAYSEGPGCGSRFEVELPVVADLADIDQAQDLDVSQADGGHRVLVVDDNRDAADALALMLSIEGHKVEVAYDGTSAVDLAEAFAPQVVFLDIGLPGMDGYQVAKHLRADSQFDASVLVAVTGYGQERDRKRARQAGFDHHIVKPAARDDIQRILAEV